MAGKMSFLHPWVEASKTGSTTIEFTMSCTLERIFVKFASMAMDILSVKSRDRGCT